MTETEYLKEVLLNAKEAKEVKEAVGEKYNVSSDDGSVFVERKLETEEVQETFEFLKG